LRLPGGHAAAVHLSDPVVDGLKIHAHCGPAVVFGVHAGSVADTPSLAFLGADPRRLEPFQRFARPALASSGRAPVRRRRRRVLVLRRVSSCRWRSCGKGRSESWCSEPLVGSWSGGAGVAGCVSECVRGRPVSSMKGRVLSRLGVCGFEVRMLVGRPVVGEARGCWGFGALPRIGCSVAGRARSGQAPCIAGMGGRRRLVALDAGGCVWQGAWWWSWCSGGRAPVR
jgi:hypothetical protein